jgi:hypothetical protein
MGVTRRANHFDDPSLQIWFIIAAWAPPDRRRHRLLPDPARRQLLQARPAA